MSELGDNLRHVPETLAARVAERARAGVEALAVRVAPVRSGRLRNSISATAVGPRVVLRADVRYARYVRWFDDVDFSGPFDDAVRDLRGSQ